MGLDSYSGRTALVTAILSIVLLTVPQAKADGQIEVTLDTLSGFSDANEAKLEQATAILSRVLSSESFREAVLGFTYADETRFSNNERSDAQGNTVAHDMTNELIYETLQDSRQNDLDNTDHRIHLDLALYTPPWYKKWSVVGYTYPGKARIYLNRYYFSSFTPAEIAGNLAHEWTHKLGFDHDFNRTARRPYSVPYAIGCLVGQLGSGKTQTTCAQPIGQGQGSSFQGR